MAKFSDVKLCVTTDDVYTLPLAGFWLTRRDGGKGRRGEEDRKEECN